ncbi:MAG: tetratricopeptide repeat protein [Pseudomonadales bacterium]
MNEHKPGLQSETPPSVASRRDDPEAYIARDRRQSLADGRPLPDRMHGCALFADLSGFTPLTEALRQEYGPRLGAEVLTAHLDRVFDAMIEALDRYGGNVVYFSGDAITAWINDDDGRRGVAGGLAMREALAHTGRIDTPSGTSVELTLKVAVAVGEIRRAVVGDPDIQLIDVLAGSLLDQLAEAEQLAESGQLLLHESALSLYDQEVVRGRYVVDSSTGRTFVSVEELAVEVPLSRLPEPPALDPDVVRPWLLPVVYERISTGRGEFLAELRSAYPVFVRFSGLDFDGDESAIETLGEFVTQVQRIFRHYGGNVLQLTLGDKGAYLYGVFGSPVAHEDDAIRVASAALDLLSRDAGSGSLQIGIAHGPLRSGTYGHAKRRTFVCLGDAVNTAARLMAAASPGGILVTEPLRRAAGEGFVWREREPLKLKGKAGSVQAAELVASLASVSGRRLRYELPIQGRLSELSTLDQALANTLESGARVVGISAEAGLGKSRLVAEFVRSVRRREILVAFGECQAIGVNTSYHPWREIWRRILDIDDDADTSAQQRLAEVALERIGPELTRRVPLLAEVLGISIADNELTSRFDAKLRKASLEDLLGVCLRDRAGRQPIVIVLEDCHWLDALSRDLLQSLTRGVSRYPVLFVLAYRPTAVPGGGLGIERLEYFSELALNELSHEAMVSLISAKAAQVFALDESPDNLVGLVATRSEGNPFYAEELLNFIASQDIRPTDDDALQALQLPDSLHSLVLSRIDALAEDPRRTLKVASVIGRAFRAGALSGVYPDLGQLDVVVSWLEELRKRDLISVDQEALRSYLFRHVVTEEVAYGSMPFSFRAELHRRVGEYIETVERDDLDPHLDLLAHHYWHGDDPGKKREFLRRAAISAGHRYANATAIEYEERLLSLETGLERVETLLRLGKVLELTGDWVRAESIAGEALGIAVAMHDESLAARSETALAEIARRQGRYDEARRHLDKAATTFAALDDQEGLGVALHVSGTVAAQRGEFESAREAYRASLSIRERLGDNAALASLHSNLAIVAQYSGDFAEARQENERALAIRTRIGDRWGIGVSENNIGMVSLLEKAYAQARPRFEEAIRLSQEVGDPWMVALARNNLGNAARELGDYGLAKQNYAASLETYRNNGDLWALAFLFEDMAILAALIGASVATFELLGIAEGLRDAIGSPRTGEQEAELSEQIAAAHESMAAAEATAARARGRSYATSEAIDYALRFARNGN